MTPEQEERIRAMYRKCFLELILLPDEALREEFPELFQPPRAPEEASKPPDPESP